jgi:PhnB protein
MALIPYLFFKGDCEAALGFYESIGLGRTAMMARWGELEGAPPAPEGFAGKPMHARFVGEGLAFCAADSPNAEPMRGASLLLEVADVPQGEALFARLAEGGTVMHPFARQFWGEHFGMLRDRFGVAWMVNVPAGR